MPSARLNYTLGLPSSEHHQEIPIAGEQGGCGATPDGEIIRALHRSQGTIVGIEQLPFHGSTLLPSRTLGPKLQGKAL